MVDDVLTEGEVLTALEELGAMQWGLVTTAQAQKAGIERLWLSRLADRGVVHRVRHGVYALPSSTHGPLQDLQGAWLATDRAQTLEERIMNGPQVVVSHISASNVHGLGDLVASRHEFSSAQRHQTAQRDVHFFRRQLPAEDVVLKDGLPTTSVSRTLADLASLGIDFDHLAQSAGNAVERGEASFEDLSTRLEGHAQAFGFDDGASFVDALLDEVGWPTAVETLVARRIGSAIQEVMKPFAGQNLLNPVVSQVAASIQEMMRSSLPDFTVTPLGDQLAKALAEQNQLISGLLQSSPLRGSALGRAAELEAEERQLHIRRNEASPDEAESEQEGEQDQKPENS